MAATLAEPAVLAAAKETLYQNLNTDSEQYAVTETQFTTATWGTWTIPDDVRRRLEPYNTLRLASGEPDLLGVGMPTEGVLNATTATTPVAVIEAKGHNNDPSKADVHTGITQAHGHLSEVNLGYVAAPLRSITNQARALARNLNIGIIGVDTTQTGTLVEPARVTGAGDFSTTIDAIRFQATTHQLTDGSFPVNHPKNYLGYALALAANGDTDETYSEYVINSVSGGRRGALLLGLADNRPSGETLTQLGAEVVRFARNQHGSISAALEEFAFWKGRSTPFTDLAPRWAQLARSVAIQYDPTQLVVEALERLHQRGVRPATIDDVLTEACYINQPLAVEVFITQDRREDVLTAEGDIAESMLTDPTVYKSGIHFQFKFQLYHIGLLTAGGTDAKAEVLEDKWELVHPIAT
ncbi:hypothetical protein [Halalkalicoccus jeotgali]|uniref:Uncharacterized protein n=1 Tax=Halalkalicoccus jeotgali (strain DSM 18796 / CECT 7217 / JCM 14584 / KCTC 4019 / B3) TaxID=795797 RepID=D8JBN9_HALJB|nr:hypothetical protein [Halalkalicoccus jeotgali]ADJ16692.1 hypothetical protein HacjB3_16711 [Halalkalicoccus jeotgali B3]ELY40823.1 hypothetical protein C497_02032 [Halalkalicoccus jeotgali B3]